MRITLTALAFLFTLTTSGQNYTLCEVHQFAGADSSNAAITKTMRYDHRGRVISETFTGYKESAPEGRADATYSYRYADGVVQSRTSIKYNRDRGKTLYTYTKDGKLLSQRSSDYKRRLKPSVDKGLGRPQGCIVTKRDYQKRRTWREQCSTKYLYDEQGKKIESVAEPCRLTSQNRYTWAYDSLGRISTYSSYDKARLIWTEAYSYFDGGHEFTRTWFDYLGQPKHQNPKSSGYWPQYTFTCKVDEAGREIEKVITTQEGELISKLTTVYNDLGLVIKTVLTDADNQPEMTHIYHYRK